MAAINNQMVPPLTSTDVLVTGVSLVALGSAVKITQIFSSFLLSVFVETAGIYLIGRLAERLVSQIGPNRLSDRAKLVAINLSMVAGGYFLGVPLISIGVAMTVLNVQIWTKDNSFGMKPLMSQVYQFVTTTPFRAN